MKCVLVGDGSRENGAPGLDHHPGVPIACMMALCAYILFGGNQALEILLMALLLSSNGT